MLIFGFNNRRADCGLLGIGKAELLQSLAHTVDTDSVIVGGKGRCKRRINVTILQQNLDFFGAVDDFFGVLRTDDKALSAENTFIFHNMSLTARKTDGFDRAVANTFITVFTV